MTNVQGLVAVVLSGIAFVFAVIGTAIPYWNYYSVGDSWVSGGLWQKCGHANGNTECYSLTYNPFGIELTVTDWMKAVRAMEILGILIIGGAGLCGFLKLFVMKTQDVLPKLSAALAIAAGMFMLIGAIVYGAEFSELVTPSHLHAGFGLVIVAAIFSFVAGVLFVVAGNR